MRALHRTAAVLLGIAAIAIAAALVHAAFSGNHLKVVSFVVWAAAAAVAVALARFLWRDPRA